MHVHAVRPRAARRRLTGAAPIDVEVGIARLAALNIEDLRRRWHAWFDVQSPPCRSGRALRMMLAWRLQELRFGGLSAAAQRTLRDLSKRKTTMAGGFAPGLPKRGTLLTREWKGAVHRVEILDRGFAHDGIVYASLSEVARAITGTRWSGPRFFGLNRGNRSGAEP